MSSGFKISGTDLDSLAANYPNNSLILKGDSTPVGSNITFKLYSSIGYKDIDTTRWYVRRVSSILNGRWGNEVLSTGMQWNGSEIPFTTPQCAPIPLRSGDDPTTWGSIRHGPGTYYYRNDNPRNSVSVKGIWYSTDNSSWTLVSGTAGKRILFIDLQGAGGGGGGSKWRVFTSPGGGGGGSGAFVNLAVDLSLSGPIEITVGSGGKGGSSGSIDDATSGGDSTFTLCNYGYNFIAGGGGGGRADYDYYSVTGGAYGKMSGNLMTTSAAMYGVFDGQRTDGLDGGASTQGTADNAAPAAPKGTATYQNLGANPEATAIDGFNIVANNYLKPLSSGVFRGVESSVRTTTASGNKGQGGAGAGSFLGGYFYSSSTYGTTGKGYGYGGAGAPCAQDWFSGTNYSGRNGADGVAIISY